MRQKCLSLLRSSRFWGIVLLSKFALRLFCTMFDGDPIAVFDVPSFLLGLYLCFKPSKVEHSHRQHP